MTATARGPKKKATQPVVSKVTATWMLPDDMVDAMFRYDISRVVKEQGGNIYGVRVFSTTQPTAAYAYVGAIELHRPGIKQLDWTEEEAKTMGRQLARSYLKKLHHQ